MPENSENHGRHIEAYVAEARRALEAAEINLQHSLYATALNLAYYAIFYAASALLLTKGITRSKHSGVISAFRQYFVKPGLMETEYSRIYGKVMDARAGSDYDVTTSVEPGLARECLDSAREFVRMASKYLEDDGWL